MAAVICAQAAGVNVLTLFFFFGVGLARLANRMMDSSGRLAATGLPP